MAAENVSERRKMGRRGFLLGGLSLGAGAALAIHNPAQAATLIERLLGKEVKGQLESVYFNVHDSLKKIQFQIDNTQTIPFQSDQGVVVNKPPEIAPQPETPLSDLVQSPPTSEPVIIIPKKPDPMILPATRPIIGLPGEGVWSVSNLPRTSVEDVLLAKTYIKPDNTRNSTVAFALLDRRRIRLHMVGGVKSSEDIARASGPGRIAPEHLDDLILAINGGFQFQHGNFGMYANDRLYFPMFNRAATVAVSGQGQISIGEWGRTIFQSDDYIGIRQNTALLVEDGQVTNLAKYQEQNNNIWGYVYANTATYITQRSGLGLTENGDLLVATANSVSVRSFAEAFAAVGAKVAMQLDMNTPYVNMELFYRDARSNIYGKNIMDVDTHSTSNRFLQTDLKRDFMYITFDETNYR